MFRRFFSCLRLRCRLVWAVLRGKHLGLYHNILDGNPTGYRLALGGPIVGKDRTALQECSVAFAGVQDGIRVGEKSVAAGCVVTGVKGYGIAVKDCHFEHHDRNVSVLSD